MSVTRLSSKKFDTMWESTVDPTTLNARKFRVGDTILYNGQMYIKTDGGTIELIGGSTAPFREYYGNIYFNGVDSIIETEIVDELGVTWEITGTGTYRASFSATDIDLAKMYAIVSVNNVASGHNYAASYISGDYLYIQTWTANVTTGTRTLSDTVLTDNSTVLIRIALAA